MTEKTLEPVINGKVWTAMNDAPSSIPIVSEPRYRLRLISLMLASGLCALSLGGLLMWRFQPGGLLCLVLALATAGVILGSLLALWEGAGYDRNDDEQPPE